jgi:formylglycine-generating enzyme required for sulfatase activity
MIAFAEGVVELGEPYPRPWLKVPQKSGLRATVAPFCLDQHPVRAAAFLAGRRAAEDDPRFRGAGCHPARDRSGSAVNCVTHTEAETWCKELGARLPRLAEWELWASRGADKRIELPGDFEWVADPSPSPAWTRRPPQECEGAPCFLARQERFGAPPLGEARFSWMRYAASKWLGNLTFRCALDRR